jgi:hypothetical protein
MAIFRLSWGITQQKEVFSMALSVNNKRWCLVRAIEITKEFGRGGTDKTSVRILKDTYRVLKDLLEEVNQEEVIQEEVIQEEMEQAPQEFGGR